MRATRRQRQLGGSKRTKRALTGWVGLSTRMEAEVLRAVLWCGCAEVGRAVSRMGGVAHATDHTGGKLPHECVCVHSFARRGGGGK